MFPNQKIYPINSATFNLTHKCNLTCSYCFCGNKTTKTMPFEIAKKSVDYLMNNVLESDPKYLNGNKKEIHVSFWGGEPLLEWDLLKDIVLYAKQKSQINLINLNFGGTTNGVLLTPEKFDFLTDHHIYFMVSLDGTEETHNKYRIMKNGVGSHSIIMKNMEHVIKRWPYYKTRISLYPERVNHFYDDIKYLVDHGMYNHMFSPVYEHEWTKEKWNIWIEQCYKVVDLISEYKNKGIQINIEHFQSYTNIDSSKWPCGAGRFYIGVDVDGSIWPCHRFIKFSDTRKWQEKEMCIGHIDVGITKPELRQQFIDWEPYKCKNCEFAKCTPCHGGCYAANFDLEGDIRQSHKGLCDYVEAQRKVSLYFKEKVGINNMGNKGKPCICNNMCYAEGTDNEIIDMDDSGIQCHCNNTNYTGSLDPDIARPIKPVRVNPYDILKRVEKLESRFNNIDTNLEKILQKLGEK